MKRRILHIVAGLLCLMQTNLSEAAKKANSQGEKDIFEEGMAYYNGWAGKSADRNAAFRRFAEAADMAKEDSDAYADIYYALGLCYETGNGVRTDLDKAEQCYLKAKNAKKSLKPKTLQLAKTAYDRIVSGKMPPNLFVDPSTIVFVDSNNNNGTIDANENCQIKFVLNNMGKGVAKGCRVDVRIEGTDNGITLGEAYVPDLQPGEAKEIVIPIFSRMETANGKVNISFKVDEPRGFGTDYSHLTIATQEFISPMVRMADFRITSDNGTQLTKKKAFDLQILVQNQEQGMAENVKVSLGLPDNVVVLGKEGDENFSSMRGGEQTSIVYTLIANNNYDSDVIPIQVNITERYGKYAKCDTVRLNMNQTFAAARINVESRREERKEIVKATLTSDVDRNIPVSSVSNDNTFAVIIANENYKNGISNVPYAINDGEIFYKYCTDALGLPATNIRKAIDATYGEISSVVEWIKNVMMVNNGDAKVIFYYAGHGMPDDETKNAYLLPVDGNTSNINTLYKLDHLYSMLGGMPSKSVVVLLDACFSGARRGEGMIASARTVALKPKAGSPKGRMVVLSATKEDQTALPYEEQSHGMFTYYLLKKLQSSEGGASLGDLYEYVHTEVGKKSILVNNKVQTPTINPARDAEGWEGWTLK